MVEVEYLNLLTDDGLRSVPLDSVGRIKLANEKLDAELRQALAVLAMGHATDKKTVTLNFLGEGKRPVRVGYIQEAPIWKTSYRLVLDDDEAAVPARLGDRREHDRGGLERREPDAGQRPADFVRDGSVSAAVRARGRWWSRSCLPRCGRRRTTRTWRRSEAEFREAGEAARGELASATAGRARRRAGARAGCGCRGAAAAVRRRTLAWPRRREQATGIESCSARRASRWPRPATSASCSNTPSPRRSTLPRQQSAMLPIVNESVEGEKVSIYNAGVHAKHPLNGLKLKNTTELHLMQGPITVFDDGAYAGDAQIQDLPPGTERLISYAWTWTPKWRRRSKGSARAAGQREDRQGHAAHQRTSTSGRRTTR